MHWFWLAVMLFFFQSTSADIFSEHIKPNPSNNTVGYIAIEDHSNSISQATWLYVKKALDYYKQHRPTFIILRLNTPGGQVYPAQQISDALRDMDLVENIPVVAFIDDWALSAGAMLAYSCRYITTTSNGSMGAAEPVVQSSEGTIESASEKINSAIRADFANRARTFGRNTDIAEAMVDKDILLVMRKGKIVRLDSKDQIRYAEPDPDIVISPMGKLLTLNSEQMMKYGVADLLLTHHTLPPITAAEKEAGKWPADKMLLFQAPFFKNIPDAQIDAYNMDWKTRFFIFLATPVISSLLFMGLILGFYIEINSPGFGIAGAIALTCLFLIGLSHFSLEIANWLELILVVAGLVFMIIELFFVHTHGLLGLVGVLSFFGGLFGMFLPGLDKVQYDWDTSTFNAAGEVFLERLAWLSGALLLSLFIMALLSRYLVPRYKLFKRLILEGNEQDMQKGYVAGPTSSELLEKGSEAIVISALRPAGKIICKGREYQAMTDGVFLGEDTRVIVVGYSSGTVIVREVQE